MNATKTTSKAEQASKLRYNSKVSDLKDRYFSRKQHVGLFIFRNLSKKTHTRDFAVRWRTTLRLVSLA